MATYYTPSTDPKTNARIKRLGYWSYCYGRGHQAHKSLVAAWRAARRDARAIARSTGGGEPMHRAGVADGDRLRLENLN